MRSCTRTHVRSCSSTGVQQKLKLYNIFSRSARRPCIPCSGSFRKSDTACAPHVLFRSYPSPGSESPASMHSGKMPAPQGTAGPRQAIHIMGSDFCIRESFNHSMIHSIVSAVLHPTAQNKNIYITAAVPLEHNNIFSTATSLYVVQSGIRCYDVG